MKIQLADNSKDSWQRIQDATVTSVEPKAVVVKFSGGIVKIPSQICAKITDENTDLTPKSRESCMNRRPQIEAANAPTADMAAEAAATRQSLEAAMAMSRAVSRDAPRARHT